MLNPFQIASRAAGACALVLALLSPVHAAPVLQMSATTTATGVDLTVSAQDVLDLSAYQFTLNFNPALLSALTGSEGTFLSNGGSTFFYPGDIDNVAGSISFVIGALIGPVGGVNGSGDLATFSFDVMQSGLANFSLTDVLILDSNSAEISVATTDLVTQVAQVPEPGSLWLAGIGLIAVFGRRAIKPKAC
ncbi:PEP-CTERM sorting domain-containing protein [Rhodoferax koreense]|nr:PEP-CTERM sorting domain-containing protein [Rhodoferax koreense]